MFNQQKSDHKILAFEGEARDSGRIGINIVDKIVGSTMGPNGRNVLIQREGKVPLVTNDGYTVAKFIMLEDPLEDLAAQALINVATNVNSQAGDGTTTSVVLGTAISNEINKRLEAEELAIRKTTNVMQIKRDIDSDCKIITAELDKMVKPVKTLADIEKVAIVAVEDEDEGKIIAEMIHKVGPDGHISVEDGFGTKTKITLVEGMKFVSKLASEFLSTNDHMEAESHDIDIVVTNDNIDDQAKLKAFADGYSQKGKGPRTIVLLAKSFSKLAKDMIAFNKLNKGFFFHAIEGGTMMTEQFEDVAIVTGAKFFRVENKEKWFNATLEDLGRAKKVVTDKDYTTIIEGKGDPKKIKERVRELKVRLKDVEKSEHMQKRMEVRIGSLAGGIGKIEVATKTDVERNYKRYKIEDAVYASKAAIKYGIVPGGGLALLKIANDKKLYLKVLREAIKEPYNRIQANAGGNLEIGPEIVDPVKVTKAALEAACSFAGAFITSDSYIADNRQNLAGELRKAIGQIDTSQRDQFAEYDN